MRIPPTKRTMLLSAYRCAAKSKSHEIRKLTDDPNEINAMPTKAFFVNMLVRDIPAERAILDLVDNCIDGAKRLRPGDDARYDGLHVTISIGTDHFEISDNCGGFNTDIARNYAFRFGRPTDADRTEYSIGQFGVGMKRALFKFGRLFEVSSTTIDQHWLMRVNVDVWEDENSPWTFSFDTIDDNGKNSPDDCGTSIRVTNLVPETAERFGDPLFQNKVANLIRSHQRQFISCGLSVQFNGTYLTNTNLDLLSGGTYQPAVEEFTLDPDTDSPIHVRLVVGLGDSSPASAGWYIVCNGRVVLSADRSDETGWGSIAEQGEGIPKFHNQYARFRGVAFFSCRLSKKLPWNTTKTGLDPSHKAWQTALPKIVDHTRSIINFLNNLDKDIDEWGSRSSPMLSSLRSETQSRPVESFSHVQRFSYNTQPRAPGPKTIKIQYSREETKIQSLMTALGVNSAKAVGEATFDSIYKDEIGDE